jgi:hypothetical protein
LPEKNEVAKSRHDPRLRPSLRPAGSFFFATASEDVVFSSRRHYARCVKTHKVATICYIRDGPTDEGRLTRDWHAEYRSNPVTVAHFARRSAGSLKPFRKIHEFDFVFHADVCNGNLDYIEALRNARYPLISPDGRQPLCNRFVQSGGRHLDGMRYPIQVPDRYAARADWHTAKISYSPFIRHMVLLVIRSRDCRPKPTLELD